MHTICVRSCGWWEAVGTQNPGSCRGNNHFFAPNWSFQNVFSTRTQQPSAMADNQLHILTVLSELYQLVRLITSQHRLSWTSRKYRFPSYLSDASIDASPTPCMCSVRAQAIYWYHCCPASMLPRRARAGKRSNLVQGNLSGLGCTTGRFPHYASLGQ